ncbi:putative FlgA [Desulfamplus magnetovallimortis]|uniref:Putative FlgA n=1 Tax=Desulfamplus magnetovallimortis TaxID=1246637 RepID=A0A1W1H9X1_9BACT|nr:flagellar basal body P-ring formation chaperone FlgA [Desulfamplus magnetovallimortis]SLM29229.1 putative FlgA [Desulfamplus magnetovallimortis]
MNSRQFFTVLFAAAISLLIISFSFAAQSATSQRHEHLKKVESVDSSTAEDKSPAIDAAYSNYDASVDFKDGLNVNIEVRESSFVNSRKFTLGEIADISVPGLIREQLASIQAGFAPVPGRIKNISGSRIESKIRSSKLFSDEMTIVVPERVYVKRASQELSKEDLNAIFEEYVETSMDGMDYEIRDFSVRGLDIYPRGEIELSPPLNKGKDLKGRVTLYVDVTVDGKDYGRLSLSGRIDIFDDVVCATRSFRRETLLTSSDINVERMNVSNIRGEYLSNPDDVVGKVLVRNAYRNRAITMDMVEESPLVNRGDMVKVVASRGNLRIVTMGIAREDGKKSDTIQVENMTSGKMINVVVTSKDEVNVFY